MSVIEFDIQVPVNTRTIRRQIKRSLGLGLPEAITEPETLNVVATGPSARNLPDLTGPVLAVNGALGLVKVPTYYAACDPQDVVADFLTNAPTSTTYYIASKCHPSVFRALRDRDVRIWHVNDYVPGGVTCAVSITLTALCLFARMGWRRFEVWGWDCCFGPDGAHHASKQAPPPQQYRRLELSSGTYDSQTTWLAEAQCAVHVLNALEIAGVEVVIHGRSMVEAIRKELAA